MDKLRKPTRPVPREPIDPAPPAGPEYPFAWYPDVAINLYGFFKDLEIRPQDTPGDRAVKVAARDTLKSILEGALAGLVPGATVDVQFAYDVAYDGPGSPTCLSVGAWLQALPDPNVPEAVASRRRGQLELRAAGKTTSFGEVVLNFAVVDQMARRELLALPGKLGPRAPKIILSGIGVTATPPASVTLSVFLNTTVPDVGEVNHFVTAIATFEKNAAGNIQVRIVNVAVSGALLIDVFDATLFATVLVPPLEAFGLREFSVAGLRLKVKYGNPSIGRRGARAFVSGQQSITFPATWEISPVVPTLTIDGPFKVLVQGARKVAQYRAIVNDFVNPVYSWKLDGQVQAGQTGQNASFTFLAAGLPVGGSVTRRVEVTVSEAGSGPSLSATRRTIVQRPDL